MREKGERARVLRGGRKGGGRILIQTESVYTSQFLIKMPLLLRLGSGNKQGNLTTYIPFDLRTQIVEFYETIVCT